ncbi:MAG: DUF4433 domain-containing protein [Verrucomicrobiota bacterium]
MPHRVTELHSIMPIANIASVMTHGILSHDRVMRLEHADVSMLDVQNLRAGKAVPGGLRLHQYANLYFCARNPMLYKRKEQHDHLCVLRLSTDIFKIDGIVFTDRNASSDYVRFYRVQDGIEGMDFDKIFAEDWRHPDDEFEYYRHRSIKCAEVLVPNCVEPRFITGAYVSGEVGRDALKETGFDLPITVNANMFFC